MQAFIPDNLGIGYWITPLATVTGLHTLPLHAHEVLLAFCLYQFLFDVAAPRLSSRFAGRYYHAQTGRAALKWRVQCVSLVQSVGISALSLYVLLADRSRRGMSAQEKVWSYHGAAGSIQAYAAGYFLWDLLMTLRNWEYFGWPESIHAVSCVTIYMLGFRPIFNYYSCIFMLYELSTPFLNVHLFLNQFGKAGTPIQTYNGIAFMLTFFSARLVYGFHETFKWYRDIWTVLQEGLGNIPKDRFQFGEAGSIPVWVLTLFIVSNLALTSLNVLWFTKMVEKFIHREKAIIKSV